MTDQDSIVRYVSIVESMPWSNVKATLITEATRNLVIYVRAERVAPPLISSNTTLVSKYSTLKYDEQQGNGMMQSHPRHLTNTMINTLGGCILLRDTTRKM